MSFGGGPSSVAPTPSKSDAEVQAEALQQRQLQARARGRASTVLTGGQGAQAASGSLARAQLMGQ